MKFLAGCLARRFFFVVMFYSLITFSMSYNRPVQVIHQMDNLFLN